MKRKLLYPFLIILSVLLLVIAYCKKEAVVPAVTTNKYVHDITDATATGGGTVTGDGGAEVTERGVCWSPTANPTISLTTRTFDGGGIGVFASIITGLTAATTYHVRAYATNSAGVAYGADVTFSTIQEHSPAVTTSPISTFSSKAALAGGIVTDNGGASYINAGVCWNKTPGPTILDSAIIVTSLTTNYSCVITGLTASTLYYSRAFVFNQVDTAYGEQVSFTTLPDVTDIEGKDYGIVNIGTQVWMTNNLSTTKYNDGSPIPLVTDQTAWNSLTTPGYCWYKNDIATYKITNGALYNWHAVSTGKLCPAGWHVPTDEEWTTLTTFLGGASIAGGKMQSNINVSDNSLFWAVPCGIRDTINGFVDPVSGCGISNYDYWWSSASSSISAAWSRWLSNSQELFRAEFSKRNGFSVRCLKN
jgi:uncharacterized protein (TIGR02145 family)